eukprot:TRINITY_DN12908_c0_g1_i1.p1 TRINITY_DN12908_c0_g1~~TRINITY_DN12908_c0_g1_i1.p1  ORF type:complete len:214 (-),score=66.40 TRINITY_DN12908_c0_g1_i1:95-736(-)
MTKRTREAKSEIAAKRLESLTPEIITKQGQELIAALTSAEGKSFTKKLGEVQSKLHELIEDTEKLAGSNAAGALDAITSLSGALAKPFEDDELGQTGEALLTTDLYTGSLLIAWVQILKAATKGGQLAKVKANVAKSVHGYHHTLCKHGIEAFERVLEQLGETPDPADAAAAQAAREARGEEDGEEEDDEDEFSGDDDEDDDDDDASGASDSD